MITDIEKPAAGDVPTPRPPDAAPARRVALNTLAPFAATLLARAMSWVLAAVMARTLGPDGTGAYAFAVNLWLYASVVSDFGLGTWLTREIARDPESGPSSLAESLGLRLAISLVALPAVVAVAGLYLLFGAADRAVVATVALLGVGLLPGAVSAAGSALFSAHQQMVFPAAVQLLGAALTTAAGAALLLLGHGVVALGWVSLFVNLVTAAIFLVASARRFFPIAVTFRSPRRQLSLARQTLPLMLNSLLNNVFFRADIQILQSKGSAVVGHYANAYKVIDAVGAIPSSFVLALFPILSRRAAGDPASSGLERVYCLGLKLLVVAGLPLAIAISASAHELTRVMWGPAFLPDSAQALRILIWFLPLSFFNGLTQYVLIALGLQAHITRAFVIAAAFNVTFNLLLIPRYSYVAAAWITIATEVVLLAPFLVPLRRQVDLAAVLRAALSPLPAALGMAGALVALAGAGVPQAPAVALAGAVYGALVWLTRVFLPDERAALLSVLPRRGRR